MNVENTPEIVLLLHGHDTDEALAAFPDEDAAALELGRAVLGTSSVLTGYRTSGWSVEKVPAPGMAASPVEDGHEPDSVGERDAIANVLERQLPGLREAEGRRDAAREVQRVIGQRVRDAHGMAAQDDAHERRQMAAALALDAPVDGPLPTWAELRRKARELETSRASSFVGALRKVLRDAQHDPVSVDRMTRPQLLDLVRSVVEAANTPGGDPTEPVPRALDAALQAHWEAHRVTEAWERAPEADRGRERLAVDRIVRAYLRAVAEGAANTPRPGGSAAYPEGVRRVARALAGDPLRGRAMDEHTWATYDGVVQSEFMGQAEFVVQAFLDTPGWDD